MAKTLPKNYHSDMDDDYDQFSPNAEIEDENKPDVENDVTTSFIMDNSWSFKLGKNTNKSGIVNVTEFNRMKFIYKTIIDPSNKDTKYYSCHCNLDNNKDSDGNLVWYTNNLCLSSHYRVAHIESFVKTLKEQIDISNDSVYDIYPFSLSWKGSVVGEDLELFNNEYEKVVYELMTGNIANFKPVKNNLDIYVLNSYDGKSSLNLNFVTKMAVSNGIKTEYIKDFFTLATIHNKVTHKGSFEKVCSNISSVTNTYRTNAVILKNFMLEKKEYDEITEEVASKFSGDSKRKLNGLFEGLFGLEPKHRNLFYIMFATSQVLDKEYNPHRHISLNQIFGKLFVLAKKRYDEINKDEE
jgi:hypothetical protein